jgi:D-alanine-D-alanine ligase
MHKIRVGVLRGGPSAEYDVSLKTGQSVLEHLPKEQFDVFDVFIDREGNWHLRGRPVAPERAMDQFDVLFNALHGRYGEDGTVQRIMDTHGARYTGSASLGSALAMHKHFAKKWLKDGPFEHPEHQVLRKDEITEQQLYNLFRTFPQPAVVKPATGGSSIATSIVHAYNDLPMAVMLALLESDQALVEAYQRGREATVAVSDGFRGEELYAFPPIEIVTSNGGFFDYDEKYSGRAREVCPAPFERSVTEQLIEAAKYVHKTLGLRDYSRSDFIVDRGKVYFLEVNTLPGLTEESLVPKAVHAVGATLPQFLEHLVYQAYVR